MYLLYILRKLKQTLTKRKCILGIHKNSPGTINSGCINSINTNCCNTGEGSLLRIENLLISVPMSVCMDCTR